jgi:hypothetical protein
MGGHYNLSRKGFFVYVPSNTVTQTINIMYSNCKRPNDYRPSPAEANESVVSYIVEMSPSTVELNEPITITLMHSGPGKEYGYESVVKALNQDQLVWEILEGIYV